MRPSLYFVLLIQFAPKVEVTDAAVGNSNGMAQENPNHLKNCTEKKKCATVGTNETLEFPGIFSSDFHLNRNRSIVGYCRNHHFDFEKGYENYSHSINVPCEISPSKKHSVHLYKVAESTAGNYTLCNNNGHCTCPVTVVVRQDCNATDSTGPPGHSKNDDTTTGYSFTDVVAAAAAVAVAVAVLLLLLPFCVAKVIKYCKEKRQVQNRRGHDNRRSMWRRSNPFFSGCSSRSIEVVPQQESRRFDSLSPQSTYLSVARQDTEFQVPLHGQSSTMEEQQCHGATEGCLGSVPETNSLCV